MVLLAPASGRKRVVDEAFGKMGGRLENSSQGGGQAWAQKLVNESNNGDKYVNKGGGRFEKEGKSNGNIETVEFTDKGVWFDYNYKRGNIAMGVTAKQSEFVAFDPNDIVWQDRNGKTIVTIKDGKKETVYKKNNAIVLSDNYKAKTIYLMKDHNIAAFAWGMELSGTFIGGGHFGIEGVHFTKGPHSGEIHYYNRGGNNVGVEVSAGGYLAEAYYNGNEKDITPKSYNGIFNSYSGGVGAIGVGYFWANSNNKISGIKGLRGKVTWYGYSVTGAMSGGYLLGAKWSYSNYQLLTESDLKRMYKNDQHVNKKVVLGQNGIFSVSVPLK